MVKYFHPLVEAALLRQVADAMQLLAMKRLAEEADLAFIGQGDADHHADGGGLAGAVRAEQAVDTSFADVDGKAIDRDEVIVSFADVPQFYRVSHKRQFRV